jgi:hypothetical protein
MSRHNLTDARVKALPVVPGRRTDHYDALLPGLLVRISGKTGHKAFMLRTRVPGAKHATRLTIGDARAITVEQARETAREWLVLIRKGVDPLQEARRRDEEIQQAKELERIEREGRFALVAEDYLKRKGAGQRRANSVQRMVRNQLIRSRCRVC